MKSRRHADGPSLPPDLRQRLNEAREGLLRVHKALIDHERARFERDKGRSYGNVELLQAVINDSFFAWLRPVSELIVQIDEVEATDEAVATEQAEALLRQAVDLLKPDAMGEGFQREYARVMQDAPNLVIAHGAWRAGPGQAR